MKSQKKRLRQQRHIKLAQKKRLKRQRRLRKRFRTGTFGSSLKKYGRSPEQIEPKFKALEIIVPDLDLIFDYAAGAKFFENLRKALSNRKIRSIHLNHIDQKYISPEAALILIAELNRSHALDRKKVKTCSRPTDADACWILEQVGYFQYFPAIRYAMRVQNRNILHHLHDDRISGTKVKALLAHFEKRVEFTIQGKRTLYDALIESMNNVAEHAFPSKKTTIKIPHEWWLLGYFNDDAKEISFSFFDQGVGISQTIRTRIRDKIRSGSSLIRNAVEKGISRTQKPTRGKGLPALKEYIDEAKDGTMVISSHRSQVIFAKHVPPLEQTWKFALPGTLITWNIQLN